MNRWFLGSLVLALIGFIVSLTAYYGYREHLLERIPIHWGISGEADGWTDRDHALIHLLVMPGAMTVMVLLSVALPYLSPREFRIDRFGPTYWYIMFLITLMFGWIQFVLLLAAFGSTWDVSRLLVAGMFLVFALMGNVMGRVKRNFWMGIRTPWTISSEVVWNQTRRLAAWLFVTFGLIGFVSVMIGLPFWLCFTLLVAPALIPIPYSLILYKRLERSGQL